MPQTLTANFAERDFDAALIANHAAVFHPLVLTAQTLPVRDRTENLGTEQAIAFRFERTVVDRFRLGHLAVRPRPDFFRTRQADTNGVKIRNLTGTIIRARTIQGLTSRPG